jgi:hypothetical protein
MLPFYKTLTPGGINVGTLTYLSTTTTTEINFLSVLLQAKIETYIMTLIPPHATPMHLICPPISVFVLTSILATIRFTFNYHIEV